VRVVETRCKEIKYTLENGKMSKENMHEKIAIVKIK